MNCILAYDFILQKIILLLFFFRYPHGNYLGTLNFIWREPDIDEINEDYETLKAQMIVRINNIIPVYCTRQMRKNVFQKVW
jgi:hypothetical protein